MPRTEDGEFELVLGNKQLLSVFFIIVILLGVFFTMGYIVGRNSGPVSASTDRGAAPVPLTPRPDAPSSMPKTPAPTAAVDSQANPPAEPSSKPLEAQPVKPAEKPLEVPAVTSSLRVVNPEAGQMYIQVSSMLAQPEAEIMVEVLGKKGFRSIIAPGPNSGKFRVLVGPVQDAGDAGKVKSDLEQAGFRGAFVKKY